MKMKQRIICLIVAVCFATVLGETVPCANSCQGGAISWDGRQDHTACCQPGYTMLVVNGKCLCFSPRGPVSASVGSDGGSVMMVEGYPNQAQYEQDMRRNREYLKQMANWIRLTRNRLPGIFVGDPGNVKK